MSVHYLIDFENVREEGLKACRPAGAEDVIYLIYTANASKANLDAMSGLRASLKIIKVAAGKQSLDMHLVSFLGFLLSSYGQKDAFRIVSNDAGFDGVVRFWSGEGYEVSRIKTVEAPREEPAVQQPVQNSQPPQNTQQPPRQDSRQRRNGRQNYRGRGYSAPAVSVEQSGPEKQTAAAEEELQAVVEAPAAAVSTEPIQAEKPAEKTEQAPAVTEPAAPAPEQEKVLVPEPEKTPEEQKPAEPAPAVKQQKGKAPGGKGRGNGEKPVPQAKPAVKEETPPAPVQEKKPAAPAENNKPADVDVRTGLNNKLQSLLAAGGADGTVAGQVASVVLKNIGDSNSKQTIYRAIIRKFGQKQGLEYYNIIKKEL